jgi:hypothetical protein
MTAVAWKVLRECCLFPDHHRPILLASLACSALLTYPSLVHVCLHFLVPGCVEIGTKTKEIERVPSWMVWNRANRACFCVFGSTRHTVWPSTNSTTTEVQGQLHPGSLSLRRRHSGREVDRQGFTRHNVTSSEQFHRHVITDSSHQVCVGRVLEEIRQIVFKQRDAEPIIANLSTSQQWTTGQRKLADASIVREYTIDNKGTLKATVPGTTLSPATSLLGGTTMTNSPAGMSLPVCSVLTPSSFMVTVRSYRS